jgi:hypothetical protein
VDSVSLHPKKLKRKLTLRIRRRRVDTIKMDLRKLVWDGMDWVVVAQSRDQWRALVNMAMNLRIP